MVDWEWARPCLFSKVDGAIVNHEQPVVGAVVRRVLEYRGRRLEDLAVTDAAGQFRFPARHGFPLSHWWPMEFVVSQGLFVEWGGESKSIWSNTKRRPEEDAELGGQALVLRCDLAADSRLVRTWGSILNTRCTW